MGGREKHRESADWDDHLKEVSVKRGRRVYHPSRHDDLPELLQAQVIASRDPRLSPSLPHTSIYSRDFDIDGESYQFEDNDDSVSFNSGDWYMDDVSDDFEEKAKTVKVKVHVNPKFLDKEEQMEQLKEKSQEEKAKRKEKVKSWLKQAARGTDDKVTTPKSKDMLKKEGRCDLQSPASPSKKEDSSGWCTVSEAPRLKQSSVLCTDAPSKDGSLKKRKHLRKRSVSPSAALACNLFSHLKPLHTTDFGRKMLRDDKQAALSPMSPPVQRKCSNPIGREESESKPVKRPEQWVNTSKPAQPPSSRHSMCCLHPLSTYAKRTESALKPSVVDLLISSHRRDISQELQQVCDGKRQSKYDKTLKHLPQLSLATQLESTFAESAMVKRLHLAALRDWMLTKPLDAVLRGAGEAGKKAPEMKSSIKTDDTVQQGEKQFNADVYKLLKGSRDPMPDEENVFPMPNNITEETVDEVFRQVHQYMDFLSKKALHEQVETKPRTLSPITQAIKNPPVHGVPKPTRAETMKKGAKKDGDTRSAVVPPALAYSPSRPTELDEEDLEDGELGRKRKVQDRMSPPSKKRKSEEKKKERKKDKKHKKKKDKSKKSKKKRKERKFSEVADDDDEEHNREPKSADSDSSVSDSPPSTRYESPQRDEMRSRWDDDPDQRKSDMRSSSGGHRWRDGRLDRRDSYGRRDHDRRDYGRRGDWHGHSSHSSAFLARKTERERRARAREALRVAVERLIAMPTQTEDMVLETTINTWRILTDYLRNEFNFISKQFPEAVKYLTREIDPERYFMWALILAIHSQVLQEAQDNLAMEEATAAAAKIEQELEEGEIEEMPAAESTDDKDKEIGKVKKNRTATVSETPKSATSASSGNKLLTAFRQQMAAKKREELGIVQKVGVTKLSPAMAAKKPKPRSTRPLFKPPTAYQLLKAAQEERDKHRKKRPDLKLDTTDDGMLRFDGVVREGLVADALKGFLNLTEDVLQGEHPDLADDFSECVIPLALDGVNMIRSHLGLAARIVIVVKERKDKQKEGGKGVDKSQPDDRKDDDDDKERKSSERSAGDSNGSVDRKAAKEEKSRADSKMSKGERLASGGTTDLNENMRVVDMHIDNRAKSDGVNEYGSAVEYLKVEDTPLPDDEPAHVKRKRELSDSESAVKKKRNGARIRSEETENAEMSRDKMAAEMERIVMDDPESGVLERKLQRMQAASGGSKKALATERIDEIVSINSKQEPSADADEDGEESVILKKFTPVGAAAEEGSTIQVRIPVPEKKIFQVSDDPAQSKSSLIKEIIKTAERVQEDGGKKSTAVIENIVTVKGQQGSSTTKNKSFKKKEWGSMSKSEASLSSQKISAADILERLKEKSSTNPQQEQEAMEEELYQAAIMSMPSRKALQGSSTTEEKINTDAPPPIEPPAPPPLPPSDTSVDPPDTEQQPPAPPPPLSPPAEAASAAEEKPEEEKEEAKSSANAGVVAQSGPVIMKPAMPFPPLPDMSVPPPPLPGMEPFFSQTPVVAATASAAAAAAAAAEHAKSFPGKYQQYPPADDQQTGYGWGSDYSAQYGNYHWDGHAWVAGPAPWAGWPGGWGSWSGSGDGAAAAAAWANWQQQAAGGWPPRQDGELAEAAGPNWGDMPPGEDPEAWGAAWKKGGGEPCPPGEDPAPPGIESTSSATGMMGDAPLKFAIKPSSLQPPTSKALPKSEGRKMSLPLKTALPPPPRTRVYVFNREKMMCKSADNLMSEMNVCKFDPHNLSCLMFLNDVEVAAVLVHQDDKYKIHKIPNLAKLKQHPKVMFLTYFDLSDIRMLKFRVVLPSGGMLIADDTVLLGLQSAALKEMCRFMHNAAKIPDSGYWSLVVHDHVIQKLRELKDDSTSSQQESTRISSLLETLERYQTEGVIDVLTDADKRLVNQPAHHYVSLCTKLQAQKADRHRHIFLLTDVQMTEEQSSQFLNAGIGIISVSDFLKTYAGKIIASPVICLSQPGNGARDAAIYSDCPSSGTTEEVSLGKFSADVFESLMAMKTTLELSKTMPPPQPPTEITGADGVTMSDDTAPRLGEAVCPDASVQPSEGCYDDGAGGLLGAATWLEGDTQTASDTGVLYSSVLSQPVSTGIDDMAMDLE